MPKRRVTEEVVKCIEALLRQGVTFAKIAEDCGVSRSTVYKYAEKLGYYKPRVARILSSNSGGDTSSSGGETSYQRVEVPPTPVPEDVREVVENDIAFIRDTLKERLDPKHPVMTKLVSDVSWWFHLILDFGKYAIPEMMEYMKSEEIDLRNPEATARVMAGKLKGLKTKVAELEEKITSIEEEYKSRLTDLETRVALMEEENKKLRELLEEYKKLVDETLEKTSTVLSDMRSRVEKTLVLVLRVVPESLPENVRATYMHIVKPAINELWGGK